MMRVLALYPWVADKFSSVREEQAGEFVSAACPLNCHEHPAGKLRLWVSNGKVPGMLDFKCWAGCPRLEILRAVGMGWKDCYPDSKVPERVPQRIVDRYRYTDEAGKLLYETVRLEPGQRGRDKDFRQRRPGADGKWEWSLGDVRRVLYHLPDVAAAQPFRTVVVAAGEKDCDNLKSIGVVATTNVCGESAEWLESYSAILAGKNVAVVEDADSAGRRHSNEVAGSLMGTAASVRRVRLPGKDTTAFLNALRKGGITDNGELRRLFWAAVSAAPTWAQC